GLQELPAAPKDVAALQEVLLHPQMGGFDEVKPLVNPTQPEMAEAIELWFQGRKSEDLVLLFFSGHGVKDDRRNLYFAAANTKKDRDRLVRSSATSARFIHDCINACRAKYQVLILDCCFSGAFGDLVVRDDGEIPLKEQLGAEGRVVLTSTSAVDYAFEEKDADLSIYTRYLVEGIASGAADEDEDGVISVDELHRYAGHKVQETSPVMSPTLITLKDEGFRIRIARSPQDNPQLKYRKEAEHRAVAGEFTIPAKQLLVDYRAELGLSAEEADKIEAEVLKPHQEYQRKRQKYQDTLRQCLEQESPLSQRTIADLRDYRARLQFKPEDVLTIEQAALNGIDLERHVAELERQRQVQAQQQAAAQRKQREQVEVERKHQERVEAERKQRAAKAERKRKAEAKVQLQREETERQKQTEAERHKQVAAHQSQLDIDNLSSERLGTNYYAKLRELLAAQNWEAADRETAQRMCEVMDRQNDGWLLDEDLEKFPYQDLRNINRLWVKYSQGKFGLSVQQEIWESCGSPTTYNKDWEKFGDTVGWKDPKGWPGWNAWYTYDNLTFDHKMACKGHLPSSLYCHMEQTFQQLIKCVSDSVIIFSRKGFFEV
ncbi:MAG: GUN4 domain-containing protein, partial [Cyanobacteria bacterium P01_D01_bin.56]